MSEKPRVTINQVARRLGEAPRRVRHHVGWLLDAGLVEVDGSTARRNARERHYRVVPRLRVDGWEQAGWTSEERRRLAVSIVGLLVEDLRRMIGAKTFGTHEGHAEVRIPGEVDEIGWDDLAAICERTTEEMEGAMRRSALRLDASGERGIEVICGLLLFEALPWRLDDELEGERRRPLWLDEKSQED